MGTMADLVADTKRQVYGALSEQINLIAAPATAGATSIVLQYDVSGITQGKIVSSGLNVWWVQGVDPTSNTIYVVPGFDNSPKNAVATGDIVTIHPRVTTWALFDRLNKEILRLSAPENGLYRELDSTSAIDPTWQTYDIPTADSGFVSILRVRYRQPGSPDLWIDLPKKAYEVQESPASVRVRLRRGVPVGGLLQFLYAAPFSKATALTDDLLTVCGVPESMQDIPVLGAAYRLIRTTESQRNQLGSQGDTRRPSEVPGMVNLQTSQLIERDYLRRVQEESGRLISRTPYNRSI